MQRVERLPDVNLHWVHDYSFTVLGITFNMTIDDHGVNKNYEVKIKEIDKLLKSWVFRQLTPIGKITVIKSLAIPKLVYLFQTLPNPTSFQIKKLDTLFHIFILNNKPNKIPSVKSTY